MISHNSLYNPNVFGVVCLGKHFFSVEVSGFLDKSLIGEVSPFYSCLAGGLDMFDVASLMLLAFSCVCLFSVEVFLMLLS